MGTSDISVMEGCIRGFGIAVRERRELWKKPYVPYAQIGDTKVLSTIGVFSLCVVPLSMESYDGVDTSFHKHFCSHIFNDRESILPVS